jgi:hypothetical protein
MTDSTPPTLDELTSIASLAYDAAYTTAFNAWHPEPHHDWDEDAAHVAGHRAGMQAAAAALLKHLADAGDAHAWGAGGLLSTLPSSEELRNIAAQAEEVNNG